MDKKEIKELQETLGPLLGSLQTESDRGVVLVISSMVENELESHISLRLLPSAERQDELLSRSATSPITSFSAKINLAYRIGVIPTYERRIFHQLRAIRNRCAHDIDEQDFDKDHFKDRMKNIIDEYPDIWELFRAGLDSMIGKVDDIKEYFNENGWRRAFELFFGLIICTKRVCAHRVIRLESLSGEKIDNTE